MYYLFMTNTVILLEFNGKLNGSNSQKKHIFFPNVLHWMKVKQIKENKSSWLTSY